MSKVEVTKEIIDRYINSPNLCPFCLTGDLDGGPVEADDTGFSRQVSCLSCNIAWTEYAKINDLDSAYQQEPEARCRVCGCTDADCSQCIRKTGRPCHWVEEDLCSACVQKEVANG